MQDEFDEATESLEGAQSIDAYSGIVPNRS